MLCYYNVQVVLLPIFCTVISYKPILHSLWEYLLSYCLLSLCIESFSAHIHTCFHQALCLLYSILLQQPIHPWVCYHILYTHMPLSISLLILQCSIAINSAYLCACISYRVVWYSVITSYDPCYIIFLYWTIWYPQTHMPLQSQSLRCMW